MNRKIIYIVGGVVAVLLLGLVLLPFLINVNQFRPQIEAAADGALNRKVTLGDIGLSIFSGGVTVQNISVSDDPAFGSGPFLTAKSVSVGVELMPLIFSRALHVTSLTVNEPEVTLIRSASGTWNFPTLGAAGARTPVASASAAKPELTSASSTKASTDTDVSVQRLSLVNGKILIGDVGSSARREYDGVNLDASDLSYTTQFPFQLTAKTPGNGTLKLSGKAGPLNQTDAQQTPLEASLDLENFDATASGFVDPASGIAGVLNFTASLNSDGHQVDSKGKVQASKVQLVRGGSPASKALEVDYDTDYDLKTQAGTLKQGEVHIGAALAHLTGTFGKSGEAISIQMKLNGENMPAADLEAMLPALGVTLPSGTSLQSGALNADLTIGGPVDRLVTSGHVSLSNARLVGFDLGAKMGSLSSLAGVPKGSDTVIQTLSSDVRVAPEGIRTDNLNVVVPAIGSMTGSGTISAKQELDYKMVAKLSNSASPLGGIAKLASAANSTGGIPFKIQGTTSNPSFIPDLAGMTSGLTKGLATAPGDVPGAKDLGGAVGGLFGKKKN